MYSAYNKELSKQAALLETVLLKNPVVEKILKVAPELEMPNWYLGAGCVAQTVWNYLHGFKLENGIKDYDLVYYDLNLSYEAEDVFIKKGEKVFSAVPQVEIRNQARVHIWYEDHFGKKLHPYHSVEEAINEWPTTATSIAVKYDKNGKFIVFAPYGLNDLWGMIVRANKLKITEDIYLDKTRRWFPLWPKLEVIPWNK